MKQIYDSFSLKKFEFINQHEWNLEIRPEHASV